MDSEITNFMIFSWVKGIGMEILTPKQIHRYEFCNCLLLQITILHIISSLLGKH